MNSSQEQRRISWLIWPYLSVYISVTAATPYALPFCFSSVTGGHFIIGKLPNDNPCLPLATGGLIFVVFSDTYFFWNKILIKLKIPLRSHNFYFSSLFTHSSWFSKPSLGRNKIRRWYRLTHSTSSVNASWWHFRFWEANKETRVIIWVSQLFPGMKFFLCKIFFIYFPIKLDYLLSTLSVKPPDNSRQ